MLRISREPAIALIAVLAPLAQLILSFTPLSLGVVTGLNAVAVAVAGLLTAAAVRAEQLVPALLGVAQAIVVLLLGFGLHIDDTQQALYMTVVGVLVGAFVRTQVTAKTPPLVLDGTPYRAVG